MKPAVAAHTSATGAYGSTTYTLAFLDAAGKPISPWHDIPLLASGADSSRQAVTQDGCIAATGDTHGGAREQGTAAWPDAATRALGAASGVPAEL